MVRIMNQLRDGASRGPSSVYSVESSRINKDVICLTVSAVDQFVKFCSAYARHDPIGVVVINTGKFFPEPGKKVIRLCCHHGL